MCQAHIYSRDPVAEESSRSGFQLAQDRASNGKSRERTPWDRTEKMLPPIPGGADTRPDSSGRIANVLCLNGI